MFIVHTLYHIKGRHNSYCGYGPYPGQKCTSWGHGRVQDTGKNQGYSTKGVAAEQEL